MTAAGRTADDETSEPASASPRSPATAVWALAIIILVLIALSAISRSAGLIGPLLTDFPGPFGRLGLAFVAAYLVATFVAILFARRAAWASSLGTVGLPMLIVALAISVRVVLAAVTDAPLYGENRIVHEQAVAVLDGTCCFSHRPPGYPIALAGAYAMLGVGPMAIEALNVTFAALTTWLVWDIGRVMSGRRVAAVAATAYALVPSQVLMTLVPLTEPMYTMLVAAVARAGIALEGRPVLIAAAGCAAVLAAAQYVRATAASLLLPILLLPWLVGWRSWPALGRTAVVIGVFLLLLLPVIAYNVRAHGDLSLSTSAYGGWSLYVGANREHGGQWNAEDAASLAGFPGASWWERSEYAGSLVIDRVMEDPVASARLLPRKFGTLWGDETYAAAYALASGPITREIQVGWLASQLVWVSLTVLAPFGMLAARRNLVPAALLIGMMVTLVAVTHLALEVHSRYHAYLVPLFCLLAATGAELIVRWWRAGRRGLVWSGGRTGGTDTGAGA